MTDETKYTPNPLHLTHQWVTGISTQVLACLPLPISPHMENPSWYDYLTNNTLISAKKAIWHVPPARLWWKNPLIHWIKRLPNNNQKKKGWWWQIPFIFPCSMHAVITTYISVQKLPSWDSIKNSDDERKQTQKVVPKDEMTQTLGLFTGCCLVIFTSGH